MAHDPQAITTDAGDGARALFAADVASQSLGISLDEVARGRATARMTVTSSMVNGQGIAHGGFVFLLADTAFACACNTYSEPAVARACEIVFLRPVHVGDELAAIAAERLRDGRRGIYDVKVQRADADVVAELRGHSVTWTTPAK